MDIKLGRPLTFREDADIFVEAGIPIFPCSRRNKRPLTAASQPGAMGRLREGEIEPGDESLGGFHRATADPRVIEDWKRLHPTEYIGIPCGEPFAPIAVLDVDRTEEQKRGDEDGHGGWDELVKALGEDGVGEALAASMVVWTATGGAHLVYAGDERLGNKQNVAHLGKLLDWRGRASGYVIAYASEPNPKHEWWWRLEDLEHAPEAVVRMFDKPAVAQQPAVPTVKMGSLPPSSGPLRRSACGNPLCDAYGRLERMVGGARTLSDGRQDVPGRVGRLIGGYASGGHITASDGDSLARELIGVVDGFGAEYAAKHSEPPETRVMRAVGNGRSAPIRDCAAMSAEAQEAYLESWDESSLPDDPPAHPEETAAGSPPNEISPPPSPSPPAGGEPPRSSPAQPSEGGGEKLTGWRRAVNAAFDLPKPVNVVDFVKERPGRDRSHYVIHTSAHGEALINDLTNYRAVNRVVVDRFNGSIRKEIKQGGWMLHVLSLARSARINEEHGHLTNESQVAEWLGKVIRDEEGDVNLYEWNGEEADGGSGWVETANHLKTDFGGVVLMPVGGVTSLVFRHQRIRAALNSGTAEYKDGDISAVLREYGFKSSRIDRQIDGARVVVKFWHSAKAVELLTEIGGRRE